MKPDSPFNPDYPDQFLARAKEEGWFDNLGKTKADSKIDERTRMVDVTLTFSAIPGRNYAVEANPSLDPAGWSLQTSLL